MKSKWKLSSYYVPDSVGVFVTPLFVKDDSDSQYFAQFSFSSSSQYFELLQVNVSNRVDLPNPIDIDPECGLIIGFVIDNELKFHFSYEVSGVLQNIIHGNFSDAIKLQASELARESNSDDGVLDRILTSTRLDRDFSFLKTLSAQSFVDKALGSIAYDVRPEDAIREIVSCSRWVTNWTLRDLPELCRLRLMPLLSLAENELECLIEKERDKFIAFPKALSGEIAQQNELISRNISEIRSLRRQELRISKMLSLIVSDPRIGHAVVTQYRPNTKYEEIVLPMMASDAKLAIQEGDELREIRVARLIAKIFVKYFPIRRGRFLVDFLRTLSEFSIIRAELERIYLTKSHTHGVKLYGFVIESLLRDSQ